MEFYITKYNQIDRGLCTLVCLYLIKGPNQSFRGNEVLVGGVWLKGESRRAEFGRYFSSILALL